jgi:hypothetical protein
MLFKVGDLVYSNDPTIQENCPEVAKEWAIVWQVDDDRYLRLRYPSYAYYYEQYHGSQARYCIHASELMKELF